MIGIAQDTRVAARMLRRSPSITIPAILVLALAIGMSVALYAVVYALWLRPLPYPEANRLVSVMTYSPGYQLEALTSADYGTWQGTRALGPIAAYNGGEAALIERDRTVSVRRGAVSGNLFSILGVREALGRGIQPADDHPAAPKVAVLSDELWRGFFGGDSGVIGRSIHVDGAVYTVTGVLGRDFRMPDGTRVDVLVPISPEESWLRHGNGHAKIWAGVGRLQPGATLAEARAELSARLEASRAADPDLYGGPVSLRLRPLGEYVARDAKEASIALLGVVGVILLMCTGNVANLLIARAAGHEREMKVRIALGASPVRIARQLLVDGLLLGTAGTGGGIVLAGGIIEVIQRFRFQSRIEELRMSGAVLAAGCIAGLVCTVVFSFAPLLPFARLRVRRALVIAELALSLALVAGSGLLLETLAHLRSIDPGFVTEKIVAASLPLGQTSYYGRAGVLQNELRRRLQAVPGTIAIAFADSLPPAEAGRKVELRRADGGDEDKRSRSDKVIIRLVDESFFRAMGIRLLQGRMFTEADRAANHLVALVNRTLADRYFARESAIGRQIDGPPWKAIIGVVSDTRNDGLENPARPEIDLPFTDRLQAEGGGVTRGSELDILIRTAADPVATEAAVRRSGAELHRRVWSGVPRGDDASA